MKDKEFCIMNDKEIWKDIKGYEGSYQISNYGNVKSLKRIITTNYGTRIVQEKIMKLNKRSGYYVINLSKYGKRKSWQIHRLVAQAFIPNPDNKPIINHKDYNRLNDNVNNLEWCTQKENVQYSSHRMKHRHNTNYSNTGIQYISYRKKEKYYRITIDKKEYYAKTLEDAIKKRDEILNEKI